MDTELIFSYLPYVLGVVGLLVLYQVLASRLTIRLPGSRFSKEALIGRLLGPAYVRAKFERAVSQLKKRGDYLAAGHYCEQAGDPQKAVETYVEGNEFYAAAAVLEGMGKLERAAEMYLRAGDHKKAGQVLIDAGQPVKAAALFYERGNTLEAARLYSVGGAFHKAAEIYATKGYPLRAAEAYEKKGEFLRAAEQYEKHFMENVSYSTTYSATAPSADQKSAFHAGRLYAQAEELERAREIFSRGGYFKEAAEVCMKLGQFEKAAELFTRAEETGQAAAAYDQAGDRVKAANLRGEIAFKQERLAEAAAFFKEGKDYQRAAELFESVGMLAEAASAFEAGESYAAAGSVYIRAGLKEKAAASYEKGRELETAAKLYEETGNAAKAMELYDKAGFTFKSGEAAAQAGERDKAIALLQKVPAGDENYRAATELLAKLFIEARMPGLAVERVQKALAGQEVSPGTLELHYWLAQGYEASGNQPEAVALYKKILAEDLAFRDVARRLEQIKARAAPPRPSGEEHWAATRRELHERGVATLQVCPSCGRCYDHKAGACAEDSSPLATPRVIPYTLHERYRLVRVLGEGGMGIVFQAHDQRLDRNVAIKIVNAEEFKDASMRARLEREARAVARIQHPGVVAIYDSGELEDGAAFLVMEMLEGCDLARLLRAYGKGRPQQVAALLRQAASAIGAAHRAGVVHRDLKPQNLFLLNGAGSLAAKVLDFGVAKSASVETGLTQTGQIIGTPAYMSPEQIQGPSVDARSDVYSLAAVGFEALTGRRLVPEGDVMKMLYSVIHHPAPLLSSLVPALPPEADQAFARALAKNPAQRPKDIEAWVESFADALAGVASQAAGWPEPLPAAIPGARPVLSFARATAVPPAPTSAPTAGAAPVPAAPTTPAPAPAPPARQPAAAPAATAPAPPAPSAPAAGKASRFVTKEEVGRGPLGTVFRAEDSADGRSVAFRVLPEDLLKRAGGVPAVVADLKAAAQVSHPNLVKVLGFVESGGQHCVLAEFVRGRTFAEALELGHKMTFQQAHSLGRVLAQALGALHAKGLVHGSVRPSNIMVASGVIKLADLGLGRLASWVPRELDYRAPEARLDVAGDLYALAGVLYHLLTGVHPRSQPQGAALPLPSTLATGVPEAFDKLLVRCLHPRLDLRLSAADDVLRELKDMVRFG